MYCRNCGKEISEKAYVCPNCGVLVNQPPKGQIADDNGSKVGWGFLSYFVPIAGLILFCIWRTERPKTSKVCGICALVSFLVSVAVAILYIVLAFVFAAGVIQHF